MIAAVVIPGFDLRAALRLRPSLQLKPAALAPLPGTEPLIGSITAAAEARGVRPGMRLGEALAMCPQLELVDQDPATAEQAWEEILRRLEDAGFAVEPGEPGTLDQKIYVRGIGTVKETTLKGPLERNVLVARYRR